MESIYARLHELLEEGETVAVATIIDVKGSVPREVGAKMLIHPFGRHVGTVGGGCGEADVIKAGLDVLQTGEPAIVRVDLTEDISMQTLGVCGGVMDVFVERAGERTSDQSSVVSGQWSVVSGQWSVVSSQSSVVPVLLEAIRARESVALATVVSGPRAGRRAVIWLDRPPLGDLGLGEIRNPVSGRNRVSESLSARDRVSEVSESLEAQVIADAQEVLRGRQHKLLRYQESGVRGQESGVRGQGSGGRRQESGVRSQESDDAIHHSSFIIHHSVFVEVQRRAPELLIVGAGHIAVPLAQVASMCDFAVTVLDDRPSYANAARFPTARKVLAAPLRETVAGLPMDADTFIVLVTRGHSHDVECLLEVLDRPVAYIGMIGSQRRVDAVFELLAAEKEIDPAKFDRIYAPIGLDIGARTPAEIAVCIMAEIVNVYRGGPAVSLSDKRRERDRQRRGRANRQISKSANRRMSE